MIGSVNGVAGRFDVRRGPCVAMALSAAGDVGWLDGFMDLGTCSDTRCERGAGGESGLGLDKILEKDIGSAARLGF